MAKKDYIYLAIILLISVISIWLLTSNQRKKNDIEVYKNNISVLNSELDSVRLKNGEMLYEINSLILEKNELEEYLDISKKERNYSQQRKEHIP